MELQRVRHDLTAINNLMLSIGVNRLMEEKGFMRMIGERIHKSTQNKKMTGNRKCNSDQQLRISLCYCDCSYLALFLTKFPNIYNICINKLWSVKKIELFSYISQCFQKKQNLKDRYIEINTQRCIYSYAYIHIYINL